MKFDNIKENETPIMIDSAEPAKEPFRARLKPTISTLYNNEIYEYYITDTDDGKERIVSFSEMAQSAARATIFEKKLDEIRFIVEEYNNFKKKNNTPFIEKFSKYHLSYVAANYFYQYLKYYYGVEDTFSYFIENVNGYLHYFKEPWTHNIPEEEKPKEARPTKNKKFGRIKIY